MSHCRLKTAEDIEHLVDCEELSVVDLSHNKLDDTEIIDVFSRMKGLVCIVSYKFLCFCFIFVRTHVCLQIKNGQFFR